MAVADERLLAYMASEEAKAQQIKQHYQWIWDECVQWYMNSVTTDLPPGAEWLRGDMIPDAYNFIESVLPSWLMRMLGRPDHFRVEAPTATGDVYVDGVYAYLKQVLRKMDYVYRSVPAMRMAFIQGHLVSKTVWHREWGERMVATAGNELRDADGALVQDSRPTYETRRVLDFNGPWTTYPDLHKLWKSPQKDVRGRALWWQEEMTLNMDWMEHMNAEFKRSGQVLYKNLNAIKASMSLRPDDQSSGRAGAAATPFGFNAGGSDNRSTLARISGISEADLHGSGAIVTKQWWGFVPRAVKNYTGQTQHRMILRTDLGGDDQGGVILRDVPAPTPDHRPPYREAPVQQIGEEPYGRTPLMWVGPEIEIRSEFRNNRLAESYMRLFRPKIADYSAGWDDNRMYTFPGVVWMPENPDRRPLRDLVMEMPMSPIGQEAFLEDSVLEQHSKETFGVTNAHQGQGLGARATRFEANLVNQKASGRSELLTMMMSLGSEKVTLEQCFDLAQTFLTEDEIIQLEDEFGTPVIVNGKNLDSSVHVYMEPDDSIDPLRQEQIIATTQTLAALPGSEIDVRWDKIKRELIRRSGIGGPGKFLRGENEVARMAGEQQEDAIFQQILAARGGSGAGAVVPGQ